VWVVGPVTSGPVARVLMEPPVELTAHELGLRRYDPGERGRRSSLALRDLQLDRMRPQPRIGGKEFVLTRAGVAVAVYVEVAANVGAAPPDQRGRCRLDMVAMTWSNQTKKPLGIPSYLSSLEHEWEVVRVHESIPDSSQETLFRTRRP